MRLFLINQFNKQNHSSSFILQKGRYQTINKQHKQMLSMNEILITIQIIDVEQFSGHLKTVNL